MSVAVRPQPEPPAGRSELDELTIRGAQRGEAWACRALVLHHQRAVHALMWRMLGSSGRASLAEDLTQEAFLRAFRALARFDLRGPAPLSSWLLSIAARTAIDELRRKRLSLVPLDGSARDLPAHERADRMAERASLARAIVRAIDQLGPEVRAAFVLRAYHELGYEEIAEALQIDIGTVKSRLWRARRALQQQLADVHQPEVEHDR